MSFSDGQHPYANSGVSSVYGQSFYRCVLSLIVYSPSFSSSPLLRFYPSNVALTNIAPSNGLIMGGTKLTITGQGFEKTGTIKVSFGLKGVQDPHGVDNGYLAPAEYISPTILHCTTPNVNMSLLNVTTLGGSWNLTSNGYGPREGSGGRREVVVKVPTPPPEPPDPPDGFPPLLPYRAASVQAKNSTI